MQKVWHTVLITIAVIAVAVADVLIKRIVTRHDSFMPSLTHPHTLLVVLLYGVQVVIFAYVFFHKANLSFVGVIQTALYALVVVGSGVLFFGEKITFVNGLGMALAIFGVILLNV